MAPKFLQGVVLYEQGRYDLAEAALRASLADDPGQSEAHAYLALCLYHVDRPEESLREADEAIRSDPASSLGHHARALALQESGRLREAESSAREAIGLAPDVAGHRVLLAGLAIRRCRWGEALEAADEGLTIDPEDDSLRNMRAMALTQLGRKAEAAATLGSALADDPENALTHANQGWTFLHRDDPEAALVHFREALRLDPTSEWARAGIVEALKARHLVYRLLLRFFLWMGRQSGRAQLAVIIGFVFGRSILADVARDHPALAPWIWPILALSLGFLLLTWVASPVFNFLLQFNRFGRLALTRAERIEANVIGLCASLALAGFAAYLIRPSDLSFLPMAYFALLLPPLAVTFKQPAGWPRLLTAIFTLGLACLPVPLLARVLLGPASPFGRGEWTFDLFNYFLWGAMLSTWLPTLTGLREGR